VAEAGIQPIIGCQIAVDFGDSEEQSRPGALAQKDLSNLVLIAATEAGYWNLVRLVSDSFMETGGDARPHVSIDAIAAANEGLIVLTGGSGGPVDRAIGAGHLDLARGRLDRLAEMFADRLYVELQRHRTSAEEAVEPHLVNLAYTSGLPLVATNEAYFPARDDYEAHDALICIAEGTVIADDKRRRLTPEHYFKSREEMVALFKDLPEATENTVEIAMRCAFRPAVCKPILPRFAGVGEDPEAAEAAEAAMLGELARKGLDERLATLGVAPGVSEEDYRKRLEHAPPSAADRSGSV
jgi:DNA polymerase-3 subunit alpha